jgi:outer membrane murein-binding lipoprotein Lpp
MRKPIITLALVAAAVGLTGCAANQNSGYKKTGISRETAQIDQLECTRSALIAKRRVLGKGGNAQEANASFWVEYHACARRNGYKRRS